ncbi:hypothetical protein S23_17010 [Bradyrhizobium cosmicum]|uniref:Uncharacterized protein n=1 Tax=Bradyrhizobium cosmicum TaxID=1404864 RepID=A0AAI8QAV0_9BRAD|nr:hypothetical protein S23_17010 [Bradyrhizobium cosmicum]
MNQVLHRRLIEKVLEALGQYGARDPDPARQAIDRPVVKRHGMQVPQARAGDRVVDGGEPADFVRGHPLDVLAQDLDEHQLDQTMQQTA